VVPTYLQSISQSKKSYFQDGEHNFSNVTDFNNSLYINQNWKVVKAS